MTDSEHCFSLRSERSEQISKELGGKAAPQGVPGSRVCLLSSPINKDWKEVDWEGSFQRDAKQVLLEGCR